MARSARTGRLELCVTVMAFAWAVSAVAAATAGVSGARPLSGTFLGTFEGPGRAMSNIGLKALSERSGQTSLRTGLQWIGGLVPATCVKDGRTLKAGRDGSIAILFDANHTGLRVRPRVEIGDDGRFALRLEHKANASHAESYSVSIRGTFGRKAVSGRVKGTSSSEFSGRCRADRTFTAKLTGG